MTEATTAQSIPSLTTSYRPVDLSIFPKNVPAISRRSAEIVNFEIAAKTYRIDRFSEAIRLDPKNALAWFNRGKACLESRRYRKAIEDFDQAILIECNVADFYNDRGVAFLRLGEFDLAVADFEKALKLFEIEHQASRSRIRPLFNKGLSLLLAARYADGIAVLQALVSEFGNDNEPSVREQVANALFCIGLSVFELGLILKEKHWAQIAIDALDQMFDRFGNDRDALSYGRLTKAWFAKGALLRFLDRDEEALSCWEDLIGETKDSEDFEVTESLQNALVNKHILLNVLSRAAFSSNRFGKGIEYYREAIKTDAIAKSIGLSIESKSLEKDVETHILNYYNLGTENKYNPSAGHELLKRVITEAKLREYIKEQAALLTERLSQPVDSPFPILTEREIKAAIAHGKKHQWDDRREQGWPYHTNAFAFVHITYQRWVNRGLNREILAQADPSLSAHLYKKISVDGLPGWLDLPTGAEARARSIADPKERAELEIARKIIRKRTAKHRASRRPSPN